MAEIKLGLTGAQVTLPAIVWPQGSPPAIPVEISKSVDLAKMLDGSNRANIRTVSPASWTLEWDGLIASEVTTILGVVTLNAMLDYLNEWTDNVHHDVVVTSYSYSLKAETAVRTPKFLFSLTLAEVG